MLKFIRYSAVVFTFYFFGFSVFAQGWKSDAKIQEKIDASYAHQQKVNAELVQAQRVLDKSGELKIASYNMGLLYLNFKLNVPLYQERRKVIMTHIEKYLKDENPDVLMVQELWHNEDIAAVRKAMRDLGYISVADAYEFNSAATCKIVEHQVQGNPIGVKDDTISQKSTGLDIFYKSDGLTCSETGFFTFLDEDNQPIRAFFEGNYNRGLLWVRLKLKNGSDVLVLNSHLTVMFQSFGVNTNQTRKHQVVVGLSGVKTLKKPNELVIYGGDYNIAPEYGFTSPLKVSGSSKVWEENRLSYPPLFSEDLLDPMVLLNQEHQKVYTQDRSKNTLTAKSDTTMAEPEQRLDHLFFFKDQRWNAKSTRLIFDQEVESEGKKFYLSDHFGVEAVFEIYK